jgi:ferredoxin
MGLTVRLEIDLDECIMAGECIYNHPEVFAWNDDAQPVVLQPRVDSDHERTMAAQALAVCPSGAIKLVS